MYTVKTTTASVSTTNTNKEETVMTYTERRMKEITEMFDQRFPRFDERIDVAIEAMNNGNIEPLMRLGDIDKDAADEVNRLAIAAATIEKKINSAAEQLMIAHNNRMNAENAVIEYGVEGNDVLTLEERRCKNNGIDIADARNRHLDRSRDEYDKAVKALQKIVLEREQILDAISVAIEKVAKQEMGIDPDNSDDDDFKGSMIDLPEYQCDPMPTYESVSAKRPRVWAKYPGSKK